MNRDPKLIVYFTNQIKFNFIVKDKLLIQKRLLLELIKLQPELNFSFSY